MRYCLLPMATLAPLLLSGCLVQTAFDVATAPIKVVSKAADWATTSQDESDRNYGRKMRKAEAKAGRERKKADKRCRAHPEDCGQGKDYRTGDY